jgi:hypothetical protein
MSRTSTMLTGLPGLLLATVLLVAVPAQSAAAAEGTSTPSATVTAVNPAAAARDGNQHLLLNAHAEDSAVENPSCRPQDARVDCWGTLVLRIPDAGGLSVSGFEVHRIAVGDVSCGDEHDDGGCGGHETTTSSTIGVEPPVRAVVNGVAVLRDPGTTGEPRGSLVQLKVTLLDNSEALNTDQVDVQVNKFVPGPVKPELYRSGPETIQQVRIHAKH